MASHADAKAVAERRGSLRIATRRDVIFLGRTRPDGQTPLAQEGIVTNVSGRGVLVQTPRPEPVGLTVDLEVQPKLRDPNGAPIHAQGRVVRIAPRSDGDYDMGIRLLHPVGPPRHSPSLPVRPRARASYAAPDRLPATASINPTDPVRRARSARKKPCVILLALALCLLLWALLQGDDGPPSREARDRAATAHSVDAQRVPAMDTTGTEGSREESPHSSVIRSSPVAAIGASAVGRERDKETNRRERSGLDPSATASAQETGPEAEDAEGVSPRQVNYALPHGEARRWGLAASATRDGAPGNVPSVGLSQPQRSLSAVLREPGPRSVASVRPGPRAGAPGTPGSGPANRPVSPSVPAAFSSDLNPEQDAATGPSTRAGDSDAAASPSTVPSTDALPEAKPPAGPDGPSPAKPPETGKAPGRRRTNPTDARQASPENNDVFLKVNKADFTLTLFLHGRPVHQFPVGLGERGSTPAGCFEIANKVTDPVWYDGTRAVPPNHPENPIGRRWMGLSQHSEPTSYGLHPTQDPGAIGREASQGCIRLRPEDAETLFRLCPVGTPVVIGS